MINDSVKEELRPRLIEYVSQITTPSRRAGKNMFVCPLCGSGSRGGRNSDGAFHVTGATWYCHSCKQGGDIFKLIELHEGLSEFPDQVKRGAELLGVSVIDSAKRDFSPEVKKEERKPEVKSNPERAKQIESFASQIAGSPAETYLKERGFSDEIIKTLRHSVTVVPAKGMFSGRETEMLICVVQKHQVVAMEKIIAAHPGAFAYSTIINETLGNYEKIHYNIFEHLKKK